MTTTFHKRPQKVYQNPKPCTAVIIEDGNDRILLTRRAKNPGKGKWDLPGGFVEIEETAEKGADREIMEELGITLAHKTYLGSYTDRYRFNGENYHVLTLVYAAMAVLAKPKPLDDVVEVRWFFISQIPYQNIYFKSMRHALKDYLKSR